MKCHKCEKQLKILDQGLVNCTFCNTPNEIKIGELLTNVPEFKFNSKITLFSLLLGGLCFYLIWPQESKIAGLSPFIAFIALSQLAGAIRSGYFSTRIGVFFREAKPKGYYLFFTFNLLLFLLFFPMFICLLLGA